MTFWFWVMYPPQIRKTFFPLKWDQSLLMYTPQEWKSWISGQCDILVLDDVPPPPRNEKVGFQVKVTFLALDNVPPPLIDWNKHECYRKQLGSASTIYQSTPPPSIILFYAWTGNWWISIGYGYMDSNPICHPSRAQKLKCSFWITFNFWWSAGLVDGLKPPGCQLKPFKPFKPFFWPSNLLNLFNCQKPFKTFFLTVKTFFFGKCPILSYFWPVFL